MSQLFIPIVYLFLLIIIGIGIGKIRIRGISLGTAGVLAASLLFGVLCDSLGRIQIVNEDINFFDSSQDLIYNFLSSLGSAFFISTVGIEAGIVFFKSNKKQKIRAFLSGVVTVIFGTTCMLIIGLLDNSFSREIMLGMFCGSMTSTPALSAVCDMSKNSREAVAGYGMSYCCGLISIIVFVKLLSNRHTSYCIITKSDFDNSSKKINSLCVVSVTVLIGYLLKSIFPIGATGGILLSGVLVGILVSKLCISMINYDILRELGLMMFFVGSGIPAGAEIVDMFSLKLMVYGLVISLFAIVGGYVFSKKLLHFNQFDSLSALCGGMTSTPAIGILKKGNDNVDLSIYAISYTGAIIALLISIRIIFWLI